MRAAAQLSIILFMLVAGMLFAQNGQIEGRIIDQDTGEPLIGANVMLEGEGIGTAADITGRYHMPSVPEGVYTVRAEYIGYHAEGVRNVAVISGQTTTIDFELSIDVIQGEELFVIAERPLIQRNTTNSIRLTTEEDIRNLPIRGLQNLIALQAGAVLQDGSLHIRGGRAGEIAYFLDGFTGTNPLYNTENINIIQEAVEEIEVQAGGYTAEFGGAASAVVRTRMRTGGPQLKMSLDYRTDDFARPGRTFLGTHAYGYHNLVATLSGPVPGIRDLRIFLAAQHNYQRDRNPSFIEPFHFEDLTDDGVGGRRYGEPLPNRGVIEFKRNHLPLNELNSDMIQGTLLYSATDNLKFRLTTSYQQTAKPIQTLNFGYSFINTFNMHRIPTAREKTFLSGLRMTHLINAKTFYEVGLHFTTRDHRSVDAAFGDDWKAYPDSAANAGLGYTGWRSMYLGPAYHSTIAGFIFRPYGYPSWFYSKESQTNTGGTVDLTTQLTRNWEFKFGIRLDFWTMRRFSVGSVRHYMEKEKGADGRTPFDWEGEYGDNWKYRRMVDMKDCMGQK